jgi:phosphomannomutase/phosphoglucomutase
MNKQSSPHPKISRGKALTQLTEDAARKIGQAFGTVLRSIYKKNNPSVILGRDARTHSPLLENAMREGLIAAGCYVLDIGMTPSPVNYFSICNLKVDGGVQITASHNPKDDNGVKLQIRDAEAFSGEELQRLREQIEREDFVAGEGWKEDIDAVAPYLDYLQKIFGECAKGKKIVVDCGNGVTGPVYVEALQKAGAEVVEMYTEPDGNFPNHQPDPSKWDTLKELQDRVKSERADLGFGFDGDGDRVGIVDEHGVIRTADEILLLLAEDHLKRHAGAPVIFTVSNSGILNTEITRLGGKPIMAKVGHSFVEHAMRENNALLGGEQSGHFFCSEDYFGFDDALVAALRFLTALDGKSVSEAMADFPKVYQAPERRPHCPDNKKAEVVQSVTKEFEKHYPVITLDGVRVDFGDGAWAGIRMSNTSPCLSICLEARSPEKLKQIEEIVLNEMKKYPEVEM